MTGDGACIDTALPEIVGIDSLRFERLSWVLLDPGATPTSDFLAQQLMHMLLCLMNIGRTHIIWPTLYSSQEYQCGCDLRLRL